MRVHRPLLEKKAFDPVSALSTAAAMQVAGNAGFKYLRDREDRSVKSGRTGMVNRPFQQSAATGFREGLRGRSLNPVVSGTVDTLVAPEMANPAKIANKIGFNLKNRGFNINSLDELRKRDPAGYKRVVLEASGGSKLPEVVQKLLRKAPSLKSMESLPVIGSTVRGIEQEMERPSKSNFLSKLTYSKPKAGKFYKAQRVAGEGIGLAANVAVGGAGGAGQWVTNKIRGSMGVTKKGLQLAEGMAAYGVISGAKGTNIPLDKRVLTELLISPAALDAYDIPRQSVKKMPRIARMALRNETLQRGGLQLVNKNISKRVGTAIRTGKEMERLYNSNVDELAAAGKEGMYRGVKKGIDKTPGARNLVSGTKQVYTGTKQLASATGRQLKRAGSATKKQAAIRSAQIALQARRLGVSGVARVRRGYTGARRLVASAARRLI